MEAQAVTLLALLKNTNVPVDSKIDQIGKIKAHIKHHQVPDAAIPISFDVVRLALTSTQLSEAGFSTLSHLIKRLLLQQQHSIIGHQGTKTYGIILDRLGDARDRVQLRAIQALTDFWSAAPADVENLVREKVLVCKSARGKQAGMQWIVKMHQDSGLQFRAFVPHIVDCLEDADSHVREIAKTSIIELFRNASERAKSDLTKQLDKRNVRTTIVEYLEIQLGTADPASSISRPPSQHTNELELPTRSHVVTNSAASSVMNLSASTVMSEIAAAPLAKVENDLKAISVDSFGWLHLDKSLTLDAESKSCKLDDIARDFLPNFEGKETEKNWTAREKNILALRRITKGNAPTSLPTTYLAMIKTLLDGILKNVNSLRTTVSANACLLVQEICQAVGSAIDLMVELFLQSLVKLCGHTKKINAANGNLTITAILSQTTYNIRLLQHIWGACQDKNVQPRAFAALWLKIVITKHSHHKNVFEHGNALEMMEKCLQKGLTDAQADVRQNMRDAYWSFQLLWPSRAEHILLSLKPAGQEQLLAHHANPGKGNRSSATVTASSFKPLTKILHAKPSIKELMAQKREAAKIARPGSAASSTSPIRPVITRPATAMSIGSLSSAPIRPTRPKIAAKKVEPSTPPNTSPLRGLKVKKGPLSEATSKKPVAKTPRPRDPLPAAIDLESPVKDDIKDDENFTMVMPSAIIGGVPSKGSMTENNPDVRSRTRSDRLRSDLSSSPSELGTLDNSKAPIAIYNSPSTSSTGLNDEGAESLCAETGVDPFLEDDTPRAIPRPLHTKAASHDSRGGLHENQKQSAVNSRSEGLLSSPRSLAAHGSISGSSANSFVHSQPDMDSTPESLPKRRSQLPNDMHGRKENLRAFQEYVRQSQGVLAELPLNESTPPIKPMDDTPARKLIHSGILRIRSRTLDAHGFRKLQGLISNKPSLWEGPDTFGELLSALLDSLKSTTKDDRIQTQTLLTIRMLSQSKRKLMEPHVPSLVTAVLHARARHDSTSHIAGALDESLEDIFATTTALEPVLEAILATIEAASLDDAALNAEGIRVVADILQFPVKLTAVSQARIIALVTKGMTTDNVDGRKFSFDVLIQLRPIYKDEQAFWGLLSGAREQDRSLLAYYIARKEAELKAEREMEVRMAS